MKEKDLMRKIIRQLLKTGDAEVEQLINIIQHEPLVIPASLELANDLGCTVDWGIVIRALTNLKKDSIDYGQIEKEISHRLPELDSNFIMDELEDLSDYINSIILDDNGCAWGEIASSGESKYSDAGDYFKELVNGYINLDVFYEEVSNIMVSTIKDSMIWKELKPVAICTITNTMSILIFNIDYNEDRILVGENFKEAIWCDLNDDKFKFGEIEISLSDCIRI